MKHEPAPRPHDPASPPVIAATGIERGLSRLAHVAADRSSAVETLVTDIVALLADSLDVGLLHLSRLDGDTLHYDRVEDRAGMGLPQGLAAPLDQTYCAHMLSDAAPSLVVADAQADPRFAAKEATRLLGIGAYMGVPLYRANGHLYGTLCALHPTPRPAAEGEVALLQLAGRIIVQAVEAASHADDAVRASEERAHASDARARTLTALTPDAVVSADSHGRIVSWNEAAAHIFGYNAEEACGQSLTLLMPERFRAAHDHGLLRATASGHVGLAGRIVEIVGQRKDGGEFPLELSLSTWTAPEGRFYGAIIRDIGERKRVEEALHQSEERFRALFTHNPDPVFALTREGAFNQINTACTAVSGYTAADLQALSFVDLVVPDDRERAQMHFVQALQGEPQHDIALGLRHKTGRRLALAVTAIPIRVDGAISGVFGIAKDMTAQQQAQQALEHQAWHDALTDLPNRALLGRRLQHLLMRARREQAPLALLLLDLDRFKEVNDTLGHYHGDRLLRQVAERLQDALPRAETVARLGGDEFAILAPDTDQDGAAALAMQIHRALDGPFSVEGRTMHVGASVGMALAPLHGDDAETLLRHADVAMYVAKRRGEPCALYAPDQDAYTPDRLALSADLRDAITRGDLVLHYQPKVRLATGMVCGVEALVRWPHPTRGLVPPDQFIGLAEQIGLIAPLTEQVLRLALRQRHAWQSSGLHVPVAVNLSMVNVRDEGLPESVAGLLRAHALPASALRLEVTESALMADTERARAVLLRLTDLGVGVSVDDYGTGYASLAYLKQLPVDELKIDRSFVRAVTRDGADAAIVSSTIGLGHSLGLQVVAEGVETRAAWNLLASMGCDVVQGYYASRPLPVAELEQWWDEWARRAA